MSPADSKIEWTDATWNPTTGCTKVSPGCAHCYAETLTQRYAGAKGWPAEFKPWTPANAAENVVLHPDRLEAPLHWKTPRRVFVNSMSDLFHENVPWDFIDRCFGIMRTASKRHGHIFQVLTKRPDRMREYVTQHWLGNAMKEDFVANFPNVWLGVTVESQRWADERIPILLDTPAAVRFVSAEPLLGPVSFMGTGCEHNSWYGDVCDGCGTVGHFEQGLDGFDHLVVTKTPLQRLDWIIIGGESGPKHRPFDPDWARAIVWQCQEEDVACFVKQLGGARPGTRLEDLPEDLRVREYPA